jgi:hypothetical protein
VPCLIFRSTAVVAFTLASKSPNLLGRGASSISFAGAVSTFFSRRHSGTVHSLSTSVIPPPGVGASPADLVLSEAVCQTIGNVSLGNIKIGTRRAGWRIPCSDR